MPTYNFKNNETGEEWEEFFTISGKEEFLEQNSHIQQLPSIISLSFITAELAFALVPMLSFRIENLMCNLLYLFLKEKI